MLNISQQWRTLTESDHKCYLVDKCGSRGFRLWSFGVQILIYFLWTYICDFNSLGQNLLPLVSFLKILLANHIQAHSFYLKSIFLTKSLAIPLTCKIFCAKPRVALLGVGARGQNYLDSPRQKQSLIITLKSLMWKSLDSKPNPFSHEILPLTISTW